MVYPVIKDQQNGPQGQINKSHINPMVDSLVEKVIRMDFIDRFAKNKRTDFFFNQA